MVLFIPFTLINDLFMKVYGILNVTYNIWALIVFLELKTVRQYVPATIISTVPLAIATTYNYFLYRAVNKDFWLLLDAIFG